MKQKSATSLTVQQKLKRLAEKYGQQHKLEIEPMQKCLHNRPCRYLDAPGMVSPMCEYVADGIFNLRECPIGLWFYTNKVEDDDCKIV